MVRLAAPVRRIRLGLLIHGRIGHLTINTETYLRARELGSEPSDDLPVIFSGRPANEHLLRMIRRRLTIIRFPLAGVFFRRGVLPRIAGGPHEIRLDRGFDPNQYREFNDIPAQLSFTPDEERRGRRLLKSMGIEDGAPFVCFHARDPVYLDSVHAYASRREWSTHDYRDCEIENYLPAARTLVEKGLTAVRMGHLVAKRLDTPSPGIVAYAERHRTDFGDIYLSARCKFFLGNTAGIFCVAQIFDVPIAAANFTPLGTVPLSRRDIFTPKLYRRASSGDPIPFRELVDSGADRWYQGSRYAEAGIVPIENTAEEILELALEMNDRLDGAWKPAPEDEELQERYRALFPKGHRIHGFPCRVGAAFLRRHRTLLG